MILYSLPKRQNTGCELIWINTVLRTTWIRIKFSSATHRCGFMEVWVTWTSGPCMVRTRENTFRKFSCPMYIAFAEHQFRFSFSFLIQAWGRYTILVLSKYKFFVIEEHRYKTIGVRSKNEPSLVRTSA